MIGADPAKAADLRTGDASVSTQTGALQYSYPITVPPGRGGMAPSLALTYSSQAPIYGGIAAGWSLPLGMIRRDTSRGRMMPGADNRFMIGESRLVEVTEPKAADVLKTYRVANGDTSYTRYERLIPGAVARWRARSTDGTISLYGETGLITNKCEIDDFYAPLTRTTDVFGNEVKYEYTASINPECRITKITWGQSSNPSAGMPNPFAQVAFNWQAGADCIGAGKFKSGAQLDYRSGKLVLTGASKLMSVVATAFPPGSPNTPNHTRTITLDYWPDDQECTAPHSPVRLLKSIQETAVGTDSPSVALPAVTFEYGDPSVAINTAGSGSSGWSSLAAGKRFDDDRAPTIDSMMLDIDGDGLLDRVDNASTPTTTGECKATWMRNLGPSAPGAMPAFTPIATPISLPRLPWRGSAVNPGTSSSNTSGAIADNKEGCALNGQYTAYQNTVNGGNLCHNGGACSAGTSTPGMYCSPSGTECPPDAGNEASPYRTNFAYRWLDMDADGLVDLVAAVHGDIDYFDPAVGFYNATPAPESTFTWPACPGSFDRCKNLSASCMASARSCPAGQSCTFNQSVIDACLAAAPSIGCHELIRTPSPILAAPPGGGGGGGGTSRDRAPYMRCEGLYPWMIYKNNGNGSFATTPVIKYQPVPLESDTGDSNLSGKTITAQRHGVFDFDGDGILDAVARPLSNSGNYLWSWFVWLGDGTGGFGPTRHLFLTRFDPYNAIAATDADAQVTGLYDSQGLLDMNGDGLSDHWLLHDALLGANVAFHLGRLSFDFIGTSTQTHTGTLDTFPNLAPSNQADRTVTDRDPVTNAITAGYTQTKNRMIDVDQDGRVDLVRFGSPSLVHWNAGGQFLQTAATYPSATTGLRRKVTAALDLSWKLEEDLIDLDGDGLPEAVSFAGGFTRFLRPVDATTPPPRLLAKVTNGRGGETTVVYAQMHDAAVVEQHPEQLWPDILRPKATARTQWVVGSIKSTDNLSNTNAITSYKYKNPRHSSDDEGRYAFRGFEQVVTTAPSLAQTIQSYSYAPDWSGRLAKTVTLRSGATNSVQSISTSTWTARTLFAGAVTAFYPTTSVQRTCSNNQDEVQCGSAPAAHTRTESTLLDFPATGQKLLTRETGTLLTKQVSGTADGDRQTLQGFAVLADGSTYRVRPTTVTKEHRVGGTMTMFGKSEQTWDSTLAFNLTNEVWFDSNTANRAISRTVYDATTGNVLEKWKPIQNAANTVKTVLTYDARKLFVATETNEVGHQRDYLYEYGTGTLLQTDGPDVRTCTGCPPPTPTEPLKEQTKIRVDGLGRTIEQWETASEDGSNFFLYQRQATSYVDAPAGSSSTQQIRQNSSVNSTWTNVKTEIDGHGRPIRTTELAQGTAPADAITSFVYAPNDGTLQSVSVPDPTQNNASTVSYRYTFDSLGRATSIRRPDNLTLANQSGVNITYDGVTKTVAEVTGTAGGLAASTTTLTDSFGRLIEVRELKSTGPNVNAITLYTYGPDDNVVTVVDPQAVTTQLTHDFGGRRTQITRHGRTWKYGYDKNGNMISEQVPGSPSPPVTDPDYTTTIAYDALDRPASKLIGARGMSAPDQTLFADRTEVYTWDTGGNMKGHLRWWVSYAPNASTGTLKREMRRTDGDQNSYNAVIFLGLDGLNDTRATNTKFNLANLPTETRYYDPVAPSTHNTIGTVQYNARNQPLQIVFNNNNSGNPLQNLAVQTRNVAGLVTKRRTNFTGSTNYVESNWTYDKLGRVVDQIVQKTPGPVQIARQQLTYLGNDNPSTLAHTIGSSAKSFTYGYDQRHQITSANETTTPGYFTSSYTYGLAGRFAGANLSQTAPGPGSELVPRNVTYQYADPDPERVTALVNASNSSRFATYQYDAAGNQTSRCYGATFSPCAGESVDFLYDGKDQLRRATKKFNGVVQGSEDYWYDHDGARVAIVRRGANGVKTETVSFVGDTEAHYGSTNALDFLYSHLSLGTPVARVKRTNAGIELEHQFHGLANHTVAAVSSVGTTNAAFAYAPFGEVLETLDAGGTSGADAHRRRFNDKQHDLLTNLSYYGSRYLDRISFDWTQSDPLFRFSPDYAWASPRRGSLYSFSLNNPIRYVDPDGKNPFGKFGELVVEFCTALCDGPHCASNQRTPDAAINDGTGSGIAAWAGAVGQGLSNVANGVTSDLVSSDPLDDMMKQLEETADYMSRGLGGGGGGGGRLGPPNANVVVGPRAEKKGVVYDVDKTGTPSKMPYIGRTTSEKGAVGRGKDGGRDRTKAEVVGQYRGTKAGRKMEQQHIDKKGGITKLDNKRNEVADEKRPDHDLPPNPNSPPKDPKIE